MDIETAKKAEDLLYKLRTANQHLEDLKEIFSYSSFRISGYKHVYLEGEVKEELANLILQYYEDRIKGLNGMLQAL